MPNMSIVDLTFAFYVKQLAKMSDGMIPITGICKGLIREVDLSGHGLDKDVALLLAGLMEHLNTVTVDKLGTIAVERGGATELTFKEKELGVPEAIVLGAILQHNQTLEKIDLRYITRLATTGQRRWQKGWKKMARFGKG